ncbi:SPOR domain-containing protein [Pseudoalteromonas sp. JB197]|uniref:SPOR domain-containing protein n=1 Tax=Pseudoalteromonas sp. JB197 TaxID=1434839 RepID=UPI00097F5996|nr:SPOR domain-containing protein [Pseudoalteromonas sp. JB197]PCC13455.1 hypothetical protein CIK86_09440 [Pseudoalteromonas sp. JB197]SJN32737.1 putative orphan protein [Pseudoalteromonas sp. JB197]
MIKKHLIKLLSLSLIVLCGCSSKVKEAQNNATTTNKASNEVTISAEELAQLRASSQQWQQAKAGVRRLLVIEHDLKLLIRQLNEVAQREPATQSNLNQDTTAPETAVNVLAKAAVQPKAVQPLFALQVASVTDWIRLTQSYTEVKSKATKLLASPFIANVETAKVKGVTFYRLKIGAYKLQNNASADCDILKQHQVGCIVSNYTEQPLKL